MTIPVSDRQSQLYVGNGINTRFDFTFRVFSQEDESGIIVRAKDGVEWVAISPDRYAISLNDENNGGHIDFGVPPDSGAYFYIAGNTPNDQLLDITNYDNFYPDALERALDKLTAILIEWKHLLDVETQSRILADIHYDLLAQQRENELRAYLESLISAIVGIPDFLPIKDKFIQGFNGQSQEQLNKEFFHSKLGAKVLYATGALPSDSTPVEPWWTQGACKVGSSLFLKISTRQGATGTWTEEYVIAEYNFTTGELIALTAPMLTLGHHELSGYIKDGKIWLVTSYQPESAGSRSGVGISLIEWKGASTNLANVQQFWLLDSQQFIGYPAVDEKGEYLYILNSKWGASAGKGLLRRSSNVNIAVYRMTDVLAGSVVTAYSFNADLPLGDSVNDSDAFNGFTANKDHVHIIYGGQYGTAKIAKYTVQGVLVGYINTQHSRAGRPYSEVMPYADELFLYNCEPEGIFTDEFGNIYVSSVESWYGKGEAVLFNGRYYLARYGMVGKSPASHRDHWMELPFIPSSYTPYSDETNYLGRDVSRKKFLRAITKISLKDSNNYDLLTTEAVGDIPGLINNLPDRVHLVGATQKSNGITMGLYDYQRQTYYRTFMAARQEIRIYDTSNLDALSNKSCRITSYQSEGDIGTRERIGLVPYSESSNTRLDIFGDNHKAADGISTYAHAMSLDSMGRLTTEWFKDGRYYVRSANPLNIGAKIFVGETEALQVGTDGTYRTRISTSNRIMGFGQSVGGVYDSSVFFIDNEYKEVAPANADYATMGTRNLKWKHTYTKDITLQPSANNTPVNNGEMTFEAVSNTSIRIKLKGSDGVVRSATLTLS
ncbi:hypothetical protein [Acinetobacter sp.]|uniref:hypothetical protein n=1 Tax=Acinetobacter sp. TaxID=472 RepID=UPI002FD95D26